MNTNKEELISKYAKKNNLIFYFVFDRDGNVKDCNKFASDFIKQGAVLHHIKEIFVDFHSKIDPELLSENPEQEHVFSVSGYKGVPESFYFTFYKMGNEFLALGRLDVMELESFHVKLIELNNELSNMSRELHKNNAELKKLNELKNTFLGMAVHDLRKPLTVINGYTRLLLNGAFDNQPEKKGEFLASILNSAGGMMSIIDAFLDITVMESGKLALAYSEFSIDDTIHEMLLLNKMKADNRKISLIIDLDGSGIRINADRAKIQQVVDNITGNAIDYTPNGGTVVVRITREDDRVRFVIDDEGPGIPENKKNNLFKAFGKTGVTKVSGEKSTGLGLLISKKIVEQHGGSIGAENKADKGARFYFTVPLQKPEEKNG